MITKVRINNDKMYNLDRWNWADFSSSMSLVIESIDLQDIRDTFEHISKIEIIKNDEIVAVYTSFDTFANISYMGKVFFEDSQRFSDAMRVELSKANIIDQVQRLDDQINAVVDPESMTIEELRAYKLKEVGKAAEQDIFDGTVIEIEPGVSHKFSYQLYDQVNYDELFILALIAPEIERLPYHANGAFCCMLEKAQVIKICSTLMMRKTQITTYANSLNMYINSLNSREDLLAVEYGMELPQEYHDRINSILAETMTQVEAFLARIMPTDDEPDEPVEPDEPEEPENPEEPTEPEEDPVVPEE